jgi:arylsulfatase A-like enzyme
MDMKKRPAPLLRCLTFLALLLYLINLAIATSSCEKDQPEKSGPAAPDTKYGAWPGDPIPGLLDPDSQPVLKVNIRGVVKNAVEVSEDKPIEFNTEPGLDLMFSAGVIPGTTSKPVKFKVKAGDIELANFKINPDSQEGWHNMSIRIPEGKEVDVIHECVRERTDDGERLLVKVVGGSTVYYEHYIDPADKYPHYCEVKGSIIEPVRIEFQCSFTGPGAFIAHPRADSSSLYSDTGPPLIMFIIIDALRVDALGINGADGDPSPVMDGFAKEGVVFTRAYTSSPFTLTSVASIFTGLFPWQHKVLFSEDAGLYLSESMPSLVERFREAGYHTAAFSGTYFFFSRNGFAQGFDHMDETCAPAFFRDSAECLNQRVSEWLRDQIAGPTFVYIHYVDPHAPYYAPEPYRNQFTEGLKKPWHSDVCLGEIEQFCKNRPWYQFFRRPSGTDLHYLRGLYQGEIAYVDSKLGEILKPLSNRLNTMFLITADHGEAFYEHKVMEHVGELHEPVMRVPFILWGSGLPGGMVIEEQVRTIDIMPTLLDLSGTEPPQGIPGRSLGPLIRGGKLPPAPAAAVHLPDNRLEYVVTLWPWKIYYRPGRGAGELYRLDRDPLEKDNLAKENPGELKRMESELYRLLSYKPLLPGLTPITVDAETRERMRALGYIK